VVSFKSPADTLTMPGMLRKSTAFVPRYQKFESISLQKRVCKLSVPHALRLRWLRCGTRDRDSCAEQAERPGYMPAKICSAYAAQLSRTSGG
jgi:hypothetical protein